VAMKRRAARSIIHGRNRIVTHRSTAARQTLRAAQKRQPRIGLASASLKKSSPNWIT